MKKFLSILLCVAMVLSFAVVSFAAEEDNRITSLDELTTGQYYIKASNDVYMGTYSNGWILTGESLWTITVDGTNVKLTDANGVTVAPKGGNNNGIKEGDYNWTVSCEDGMFTFAGQGSDTVKMASNTGSDNKFRGYKNGTISGNPAGYPSTFALYKAEGGAPETPVDPPVEPEEPTLPEYPGVADVTLENGMQVVIFNPAYNMALSSTAAGYYSAGVEVTMTEGVLSGYGDTETWTVVANDDGTYSFEQNGQKIAMQDSYTSMSMGAVNDDWNVTSLGNGLYNIQNAVRSTYMEWYNQYSNWSTYAASDAATNDLFQLAFYVVTGEEEPVDPPAEPEEPTLPEYPGVADVTLENGMQVVIFNPAYNMALSSTAAGYYSAGVEVTMTEGVLSGYGDTETWTVVANDDGTYSFEQNGQKIAMQDSYTSMSMGAVNDDWNVTSLGNGLYNIQNAVRSTYMEWYNQYSNWSTYAASDAATNDLFQLAFYVVPAAEPETPELVVGDNTITLTDDEAATGKTVTFTSEEGGVFIFSTEDVNASFYFTDNFAFVEAGDSTVIILEPGQTITIECYTYTEGGADLSLHIEEYEIPEGVVDTELELGENTVFVPMDNAYLGLEVTFVAENAGTYIFTTGENAWLFNIPGGNVRPNSTAEVALEAGETLTFKVGTDNELADNVLVTIELKEEEPVDPPVVIPGELVVGENTIFIEDGYNGLEIPFIAPADGIYTFTVMTENGYIFVDNSVAMYNETVEVTMTAGQTIDVWMAADDYNAWEPGNLVLTVGTKEADPDDDRPVDTDLEAGENNVWVPADNAKFGLECTFVATEAGTYIVTAGDNAFLMTFAGNVKPNETLEITLEAGQSYEIKVGTWDENADEVLVKIELKEEEPVDPPVDPEDPEDPEDPVDPPVDPEDPIDPTGDNTLVFFALVVLSMTGLVVLVSKKRAF